MNMSAGIGSVWHGRAVTVEMRKEMRKALYNSAGRIVLAAKARVPRRTGALQRSIRRGQARDEQKAEAYVFAGNRAQGIYWHGFVEYGTVHMAAQPYLRPAADGARHDVVSGAKRAVRAVVNKPRTGSR